MTLAVLIFQMGLSMCFHVSLVTHSRRALWTNDWLFLLSDMCIPISRRLERRQTVSTIAIEQTVGNKFILSRIWKSPFVIFLVDCLPQHNLIMTFHDAVVGRQMLSPVCISKGILWNESRFIDLHGWLILQNGGSVILWINVWFISQVQPFWCKLTGSSFIRSSQLGDSQE